MIRVFPARRYAGDPCLAGTGCQGELEIGRHDDRTALKDDFTIADDPCMPPDQGNRARWPARLRRRASAARKLQSLWQAGKADLFRISFTDIRRTAPDFAPTGAKRDPTSPQFKRATLFAG